MNNNTIIILDFGSQYTQLIARRIREIGVFSVTELSFSTTDNAFNDKIFEEFVEGLNESGLSQYVNLMGWIRNPYPLMKSMDAYILPSRYEGFPNSLIEALALGLPSIVSRSPGANEEIVTDGFNGLTFENENASDLRLIKCVRSQITLKILTLAIILQYYFCDILVDDYQIN